MDMTAIKASFGRWIEAANQADGFTLAVGNMPDCFHELTTGKITNLAPPQGLHTFHGKVFKVQIIVSIRQFVGKLKEPVAALVDYPLIKARDNRLCFLPSSRKLYFAGEVLLGDLQVSHRLPIVQRAFNFFSVRCSEEDFQPKVKARAFTRHDLIGLAPKGFPFFLYDKVQIEIAKAITLDGDRLDACRDIAALAEFIDRSLYADLALRAPAVKEFPAGLLEGERAILFYLLETWWGGAYFSFEITEKQAICFVNAFNDILNSLTTYQIPMLVFGKPLKLCGVLHQSKLIQAFAGQLIVFAVQRNTVIIYQPTDIDLPVQTLILFLAVELEFVRFHRLISGVPGQLVDQRLRSYFRRSLHKSGEASAVCQPICGIGRILFPYVNCMLMHAKCMYGIIQSGLAPRRPPSPS
jgi:hypothetical protein